MRILLIQNRSRRSHDEARPGGDTDRSRRFVTIFLIQTQTDRDDSCRSFWWRHRPSATIRDVLSGGDTQRSRRFVTFFLVENHDDRDHS